jgi:cytidine deaminase
MIAAGSQRALGVWILADGDRPCPPCGDCRQRLAEFCDASVPVLLVADDGRIARRLTVGALLPESFTLAMPPAG